MNLNRIANCKNPFQGEFKKVLCVCSAGLLRSPTAAVVLAAEPFNFNTRAVGCVSEYALLPVDEAVLAWADEIVCMEKGHARAIHSAFEKMGIKSKPVICLNVPDNYPYRSPQLMALIKKNYEDATIMAKAEVPDGDSKKNLDV